MGIFEGIVSIGHAISGAFSKVCSCVSNICNHIAGALGGTALGGAINSFITKIGVVIPGLDVISAVFMIADIVCKIAEALKIKNKEDEPDELAMKAEKDDMKPDDFDSTEAYIKHLQHDIQLTKEEKDKLEKMSAEEKTAYRATGTYLYAKACSESLGFDTSGLKNPELVGLTVEVLADLAKIKDILSPNEFIVYSKFMQENSIDMKQFSDYLHNRSDDLKIDEKVQSALIDAMKELDPNISDEAIDRKLYEMNIED